MRRSLRAPKPLQIERNDQRIRMVQPTPKHRRPRIVTGRCHPGPQKWTMSAWPHLLWQPRNRRAFRARRLAFSTVTQGQRPLSAIYRAPALPVRRGEYGSPSKATPMRKRYFACCNFLFSGVRSSVFHKPSLSTFAGPIGLFRNRRKDSASPPKKDSQKRS